jgi:hypothetical protein
MAGEMRGEEQQPAAEEYDALGTLEKKSQGRSFGCLESRPAIAAIAAVVTASAILIMSTLLLVDSRGEICPGYKTDVLGYYGKMAVLALGAAALAALLGGAIGWPGHLLAESGRSGWAAVRFVFLAVLICGVGCVVILCIVAFVAVFPGGC